MGLSVDFATGRLIGCRVFPALVGPVVAMDVDTAEDLLARADSGAKVEAPAGYTESAVRDLVTTYQLMKRVIAAQPWIDATYSSAAAGGGRETVLNKRTGTYSYGSATRTAASRMVNALLTVYSNSAAAYCATQGLPVPIAWENRDRIDSSVLRRFGTQPLRNWLAQMQQAQIRASVRMNPPLTRAECALAVSHVNNRRKQQAPQKQKSRQATDFDAFVTHCASVKRASGEEAVVEGELLGDGLSVRLTEFNVQGRLSVTPADASRGRRVRARVRRVQTDSKTVLLDLL